MIAAAASVCCALLAISLAVYFAAPAGRWRARTVRRKALARALFPRRIVRSRSGRADIGFMIFSLFFAGATMGWALWSSNYFETAGRAWLATVIRTPPPIVMPGWAYGAILSVALYLAYEFAYWVNHWLSHRVPLLWEFHKVHHTAESLSMITNFRVHPVDTILFYNMVAVTTGFTAAALGFACGQPVDPFAAGGTNLIMLLSTMVLTNLQHSHLWISMPGRWGRVLLSPAHHQIHHSTDLRHHNRNFGSTLAVFDALFGTLHLPAAKREKLRFGVDGLDHDPHGAIGAVLLPFVDAGRQVAMRCALRREKSGEERSPPGAVRAEPVEAPPHGHFDSLGASQFAA